MRAALIFLAAGLLAPATPDAAPFAETGVRTFRELSCVAATGAPGELARVPLGEGERVQLLQAGRAGITAGQAVPLHEAGCASVAARPDGSGLAAGVERADDDSKRIFVATRPAGGSFGAPVAMTTPITADVADVTAALDDAGDAIVAWRELDGGLHRIRAVVRPAGGAFGAPVVIAREAERSQSLLAGIGADGAPVVAWTGHTRFVQLPIDVPVRVSVGLGPPQTVGTIPLIGRPALAVAPDGRALLALPGRGTVSVAERPPGGGFGAPAQVGTTADPAIAIVAVAAGAGGRAAVLWRGAELGDASLVTRAGTGPFGPPVLVARRQPPPPGDPILADEAVLDAFADEEGGSEGPGVAVALAPSGAVAVLPRESSIGGVPVRVVLVASVPLAGGPIERSQLGGGLRRPDNLVAFAAQDGDAGAAWVDDGTDGWRLHAAAGGVTAPAEPAAPRVRIAVPRQRTFRWDDSLTLPVRCGAACDVRAYDVASRSDGVLSLRKAGRGKLQIPFKALGAVARRHGRTPIRLLYGAPGAQQPRSRRLSFALRLKRTPRIPHPRALRAVRRGDRVRVTWTLRHPSEATFYLLTGQAARGGTPRTLNFAFDADGVRRFSLKLSRAQGVEFVALHTFPWRQQDGSVQEVRVR